jgi:NAD(P)H-dependent flavin oxidoreductase YrpB (nitropropane dioxygenase family)
MTVSLNTRITDLLGCQYPIIQTAMGWVADPRLVAGTCNAGGFGFLAGATIPPEQMEASDHKNQRADRQTLWCELSYVPAERPQIVDMVVKYGVRAVSYSRSPGKDMVKKLKDAGVICMPTIGLPKHAAKAIEMGADAVTIQGGEGGGHTGAVPTTLLVPQVIDAVAGKVPVLAAGGFKDGRGLVAAMAWGADGIAMGTRFLLTQESPVPEATKQRYLACKNPAEIIVSTALDGMPQRMILNEFLSGIEKASLSA